MQWVTSCFNSIERFNATEFGNGDLDHATTVPIAELDDIPVQNSDKNAA
jgi:hypothetical protein